MKRIYCLSFIVFSLSLFFGSCTRNNPDSSGVEYMPDMYRSPSYEDNSVNYLFPDSMTDRLPVAGTVPVGFTPDPFPNTPEGLANAAMYLKDPFPATPEIIAEGKTKFEIYCIHCHGPKGMGDGPVAAKLPGPPPAYSTGEYKNYPEGEIFQIMEYGKNLMGSHASQISANDRWKIVRYVQTLQHLNDTLDTAKAAMPHAPLIGRNIMPHVYLHPDTTKKGK